MQPCNFHVCIMEQGNAVCLFDVCRSLLKSTNDDNYDLELRDSLNMGSELYNQQKSGKFCDVTIITSENEEILAHGCVLAAASSYLNKKFEELLIYKTSELDVFNFYDSQAVAICQYRQLKIA